MQQSKALGWGCVGYEILMINIYKPPRSLVNDKKWITVDVKYRRKYFVKSSLYLLVSLVLGALLFIHPIFIVLAPVPIIYCLIKALINGVNFLTTSKLVKAGKCSVNIEIT